MIRSSLISLAKLMVVSLLFFLKILCDLFCAPRKRVCSLSMLAIINAHCLNISWIYTDSELKNSNSGLQEFYLIFLDYTYIYTYVQNSNINTLIIIPEKELKHFLCISYNCPPPKLTILLCLHCQVSHYLASSSPFLVNDIQATVHFRYCQFIYWCLWSF